MKKQINTIIQWSFIVGLMLVIILVVKTFMELKGYKFR